MNNGSVTQSPFVPALLGDVSSTAVHHLLGGSLPLRQVAQDHVSGRQRLPVKFELAESRLSFWAALETLGEHQSLFAYWAELKAHRKREIASGLLLQHSSLIPQLRALLNPYSHDNQVAGARSVEFFNPSLAGGILHSQYSLRIEFPFSADHQLFSLIQYNALRGALTNMSILLFLNGRELEGWADFDTEDLLTLPDNAPFSLQPTSLQKTVRHESWVDVIPYAILRDNIIRNQENLDGDELCNDFLGGMYEGLSDVQNRGLILWGEPWSESGWELSEGFAKKWSFLLKGCDDLLESTNKWRDTRGEERLVVEI